MRRCQIFLQDELNPIGDWLQQAERAHAGWSPAVLHASHHLALQPDGVGHRPEQNVDEDQALDCRNYDISQHRMFVIKSLLKRKKSKRANMISRSVPNIFQRCLDFSGLLAL